MKMDQGSRLLRIGIFYDGNYFYHVSNYYCYAHARRSRLSIQGLHDFIREMVSEREEIEERLCQIVDCHYFRGRFPAMEANARQLLLNERIFDDILMREGVVTHYLPIARGVEKGVDVSLSLETLELTIFKKFNVVVLIASDSDYVPLVRKLNSLGTRVMVLGWDFEYMDDNGNMRSTSTSQKLLNEASYPVRMHRIIDGEEEIPGDVNVDSLFVSSANNTSSTSSTSSNSSESPGHGRSLSLWGRNNNTTGSLSSSSSSDEMETLPGAGESEAAETVQTADTADTAEAAEAAENPERLSSGGAAYSGRYRGRIVQLKNGYGFLETDRAKKNLFFFWEDVENCDFNQLQIGDLMEYELGKNDRGECARNLNRIVF